jgi:hypothetical protein
MPARRPAKTSGKMMRGSPRALRIYHRACEIARDGTRTLVAKPEPKPAPVRTPNQPIKRSSSTPPAVRRKPLFAPKLCACT